MLTIVHGQPLAATFDVLWLDLKSYVEHPSIILLPQALTHFSQGQQRPKRFQVEDSETENWSLIGWKNGFFATFGHEGQTWAQRNGLQRLWPSVAISCIIPARRQRHSWNSRNGAHPWGNQNLLHGKHVPNVHDSSNTKSHNLRSACVQSWYALTCKQSRFKQDGIHAINWNETSGNSVKTRQNTLRGSLTSVEKDEILRASFGASCVVRLHLAAQRHCWWPEGRIAFEVCRLQTGWNWSLVTRHHLNVAEGHLSKILANHSHNRTSFH